MPDSNIKLRTAVEEYFRDLRNIRASRGATPETSTHTPLTNLLNAVGGSLKPKVFCINEVADIGAGRPDLGLFAANQVQKGQPRKLKGRKPEYGVVEVKPPRDNFNAAVESGQVERYWEEYRLVLVTNTRDFVLLGEDAHGNRAELETLHLAPSDAEFDKELQRPRAFANRVASTLTEYLQRVLSHQATLVEPRDLARLLASYARDGLARVEASEDGSSLNAVRSALEEALGVKFVDDEGAAFFRSTLVQTLFYGVFSAWVLWARQTPTPVGLFNWHESVWHLRAPVIRALFLQLSDPGKLQPLGLVEVLDWTATALNRVDRDAFFAKFNQGEAIPYFYEPFLEEFDPKLRGQLGVWYTPPEVVRYMVARVDMALKDDLGIEDGLAGENVYVLDPCCGTGAYLAETLKRIAANLEGKGLGDLLGAQVKKAATERVFGFEIMPAPFIVAHLQVGLTMQALDAAFSEDGDERAGVFLTNALTGWENTAGGTGGVTQQSSEPQQLPMFMPELQKERERAERVKQHPDVLVVIGNPPYNGFAGMAIGEEADTKQVFKNPTKVKKPRGQGLNDLYTRFFRMAEQRIVDMTGRGVICFISNYSWLDGLSFTGMREHFLDSFDAIHIDCLNGDKYKTGKTTPDGKPDPSIFSTPEDAEGIQVGTAIATLIRKTDHVPAESVGFRHLWGQAKLKELTDTAETAPAELYDTFEPVLPLGLPFAEVAVNRGWSGWPSLPELFPKSFPGVKTSRDSFLVDVDANKLKQRLADFFDSGDAGWPGPSDTGFIRYAYRPFDTRWLYWEGNTGLLDRPRPDYKKHVSADNIWLEARQKQAKEDFSRGTFCRHLADNFGNGLSSFFPAWLLNEQPNGQQPMPDGNGDGEQRRPNLSPAAQKYLDRLGLGVEDLFYHTLWVMHDPAYRKANAGALRMEWPRIWLPGWPNGNAPNAADGLSASAARGRELAVLLDPETPVTGVTTRTIRPELAAIAVPLTTDGHSIAEDDFALTVGWGHVNEDVVMPGKGRAEKRSYTPTEREVIGNVVNTLGESTFDLYLNDNTYWSNIPAAVWNYKLGGYQVLKKWLSYRESKVLGRHLCESEVRHFRDMARRIAAILKLTGSE